MKKNNNKSKSYQYKIVEIPFEQNKLSNFPMERGIGHIMHENEVDEKIAELRERLKERLYDLIVNENILTDHQKKILFMRLAGKTQIEIAQHLGCTQSAVHKSEHGNIDYKNSRKRYGGINKKLKKICSGDDIMQDILIEIEKYKKNREI
jgi:DNA-directed RNA polymerase specialized sigma subunit